MCKITASPTVIASIGTRNRQGSSFYHKKAEGEGRYELNGNCVACKLLTQSHVRWLMVDG